MTDDIWLGILQVVAPLDPKEGNFYVEYVRKDLGLVDLDNIYNVTIWHDDYVNPPTYGALS